MLRTPLALRQIWHERNAMIASTAGVCFAVLLMSLQYGLRNAVYESAVRLHRSLRGDVVLISREFISLTNMPRFPRRYLYQARGVQGVVSAEALYVDVIPWRNPVTQVPRLIYLFGFNPERPVLDLPELPQLVERIKLPSVVLFDRLSRAEFGPIVETFSRGEAVIGYVSADQRNYDPRVEVGGLFTLGPSFVVDGNLITSDLNFTRITSISPDLVTIGVLKVEPGADPEAVVSRLAQVLPPDVRALTAPDFIHMEKDFWANHTGIGWVIEFGLLMGFVVGVGFTYQVLHNTIQDHLPEYAVLKTMGYTNGYLTAVVLQLALILGMVGYLAGVVLAMAAAASARQITHMNIEVASAEIMPVLLITVIMCLLGGLLASRRLRAADPVEVFS